MKRLEKLSRPITQVHASYYEFRRFKSLKACFPIAKQALPTENLSANSVNIFWESNLMGNSKNSIKVILVGRVKSSSNRVDEIGF